jgi:hypothetical protein
MKLFSPPEPSPAFCAKCLIEGIAENANRVFLIKIFLRNFCADVTRR